MSDKSSSFNTMEVRPWEKPQLLHSKPLSSNTFGTESYATGVNWLDADRNGNISIKAYVSSDPNGRTNNHLDAKGNTVLYSAGSDCLRLCKNDRDFQCGTFSTEGKESSSPTWSTHITFEKPYACTPKVVVWFNEFDIDKNHNSRLQASAEDLTPTGFILKLSCWGDTKLYKAGVTWIAHPSSRSNIASGTFDTREFRPWSAPKLDNKKDIAFDKPFECVPRVLVGLNLFDIDCSRNFRLKCLATDVTTKGMALHLDSWFDTTHYASRADYIAIQDF